MVCLLKVMLAYGSMKKIQLQILQLITCCFLNACNSYSPSSLDSTSNTVNGLSCTQNQLSDGTLANCNSCNVWSSSQNGCYTGDLFAPTPSCCIQCSGCKQTNYNSSEILTGPMANGNSTTINASGCMNHEVGTTPSGTIACSGLNTTLVSIIEAGSETLGDLDCYDITLGSNSQPLYLSGLSLINDFHVPCSVVKTNSYYNQDCTQPGKCYNYGSSICTNNAFPPISCP